MNHTITQGNLITLALEGKFDLIAHGVNCFCTQASGLAPQMVKAFGTNEFRLEDISLKGDIRKLGAIDYEVINGLTVINCYTQYNYGSNHKDGVEKPLDYQALTLCMRKINHIFKGKHIGLPYLIGCGLAGGNKSIVEDIISSELKDMNVTLVKLK